MVDVYEGKADGRQAQTPITPTKFRPRYRQLTDAEKELHDRIKSKAEELDSLFNQVPDGRYKSLAGTHLENSVMWIVKQLTS